MAAPTHDDDQTGVEAGAPPTPPALRAPMTAGRAIATVLAALAVAALVGAPSLERVAERQGYGTGRDVALALVRPLASLSSALRLDRPREWLADATGHEDPPVAKSFGTGVAVPTTTSTTTTTTTTAPVDPATTTVPTTTAPVTTTTAPARRVPSQDAPLRVWLGGDSLMGTIAEQVGGLVGADRRVSLTTDVQVSTGLVRSDVLDWPAELAAQMDAVDPEVVVLSFGGNDDQPLHLPDGSTAALFTPEWQAEYARRAGIIMDIASKGATRTVIWLGLPAERPENLDGAKEAMNAASRAEAARRTAVVYLPLGPPLAGPDGGYADELVRGDGSTFTARTPDGVHLTGEGAAVVAPLILDAFATEWHLR